MGKRARYDELLVGDGAEADLHHLRQLWRTDGRTRAIRLLVPGVGLNVDSLCWVLTLRVRPHRF